MGFKGWKVKVTINKSHTVYEKKGARGVAKSKADRVKKKEYQRPREAIVYLCEKEALKKRNPFQAETFSVEERNEKTLERSPNNSRGAKTKQDLLILRSKWSLQGPTTSRGKANLAGRENGWKD